MPPSWCLATHRIHPGRAACPARPVPKLQKRFYTISAAVESAAATWNTGRFQLLRVYPYDGNGNIVSAANFDINPPCYIADPRITYAVNCLQANPTTISRNRLYFNTSSNYSWNTSGNQDCNFTPQRHGDVQHVALHELGHSYQLVDSPASHPEAVMSFQCTLTRSLAEDDKHGIAMIYGARTNWESGFANGLINRLAYGRTIAGYYNSSSPPPESGPRSAENGVSPYGGVKMEVLDGYAQSSYSYAYHDLFTYIDDSGTQRNYLVIQPGMRLVWVQYNYQQGTFGADLQLAKPDGTRKNLRDSGLMDSLGNSVHPAERGIYGTGYWFGNSVDLTPLAGWEIERWMIAYDNGKNSITGQYRAYFENYRVEYP